MIALWTTRIQCCKETKRPKDHSCSACRRDGAVAGLSCVQQQKNRTI